jgi:uncharacterized protein
VTAPSTAAGEERDRDQAGRPKNARPRDGLGRPLARGAAGEPVTPEDLRLTPTEAVRLAQDLIDDGRPFHAHEVLEATWKSAPADERALWKGLAQIAVGLTHARRGNSRGAVTLLRRGAAAVADYARGLAAVAPGGPDAAGPGAAGGPDPAVGLGAIGPAGLDLAAVAGGAAGLADRIDGRGLGAVPAPDLRVALTG